MSITSQNPVKPSLAVEVFRALNELQALGPSLQQVASLGATNTAIIWRHYDRQRRCDSQSDLYLAPEHIGRHFGPIAIA